MIKVPPKALIFGAGWLGELAGCASARWSHKILFGPSGCSKESSGCSFRSKAEPETWTLIWRHLKGEHRKLGLSANLERERNAWPTSEVGSFEK